MDTQRSEPAWDPQPADWGQEAALRIATEMRRLRGKTSTQALADRTAQLGYAVSRSVLSDLENGRRRHVTIAELMVLARALNTTPIALLFPDPDGEIEILPGVKSDQGFALQWFSGFVDVPSLGGDQLCDDKKAYAENLRPIELAREVWELREQKAALMREGLVSKSQDEKRVILREVADINRKIRKLKGDADDE